MEEVYFEMKEESYGIGPARPEKIDPVPVPPEEVAADLFSIFKDNPEPVSGETIRRKASVSYTAGETKLGLRQLRRARVIVPVHDNFTFQRNPNLEKEVNPQFLSQLRERMLAA